MKLYLIKHLYDTDGGFGDSISNEKTVCVTLNKTEAEEFVKKYSNPHIYDEPYDSLWCGELSITEIELVDNLSEYGFGMESGEGWPEIYKL